MAISNTPVIFGKGKLPKVINKLGVSSENANVYFGYDDELGSGVVVANGKLASSKILDITSTDSAEHTGVKTISVVYIDTENKEKKTTSFEVISYDGASSLISEVMHAEDSSISIMDASISAIDSSISSIQSVLTSNNLIGAAKNENQADVSGVTITPVTNSEGFVTYTIKVEVDNDSIKLNANGKLATNKYALVSREVQNANNSAEYEFTVTDITGETTTTLIEIPLAQAIKTAHLCKYILGSNLTEEEKESLTEPVNNEAYYEVNIDTNKASKVDSVPSQVTIGEKYLHFEWGGVDVPPTFLNVADIAVNYVGSTYVTVDNNVISVKYNELATALAADAKLHISTIDSSIKNLTENIESINSQIETINTSINDINTSIGALDSSISALDTSIAEIIKKAENNDNTVENINTSIQNINSQIETIDTSIVNINNNIELIDSSVNANTESISNINDKLSNIDSSFVALDTKLETIDSSFVALDSSISALDTSIKDNASNITLLNTSINNIYEKLSWIDLDA